MKLFGDTLIQPDSRTAFYWDIIVLVATIYVAIEIPLAIVFDLTGVGFLAYTNWIITSIYAVDIFANFNLAYVVQGKLITDKKLIARKYMQSWFTLDVLATIPFGLFITSAYLPINSFLRVFRLNRLIKLTRITRTLRRAGSTNINPAILRLFMLVFWVMLAAHFISCAWIFISDPGEVLDTGTRYIRAFYWTITTLTTIGYGDITPGTNLETIFVIFIELIGAGMYGLIIGNIANLIANIDVAKTQHKEKTEKINTFLKYKNIPFELQKKINDYYEYLWESRRGYNEATVLGDLPTPLKTSVSIHIHKEIIEKVPIFEGASDAFIREIILNLKPVVFTPGDYIVVAGDIGYDMFFISKGSVDVLSADESTHFATLSSGQFFGEIALLLSTPRTATIKAREYSDLYSLDKDTFERVLERFPDFAKNMQALADQRKAEIEAKKKK